MKKYYSIIIFFLLIGGSIYSQEHIPIVKEGSFWDTSETGPGCYYINRLAIDKDTIINNNIYKSLKSLYFRNANGQVDCLTEPYSAHESDFEPVLGYFLREDISEKRLYIYVSDEHENPGEYLLADFTLEVGDIMPNAHGGAQGGIPMSITQLDILPDERKKYTLGDGTTVSEGIGKENGQLRVYGDIGNGITYSYHCHGNDENQNGCLETLSMEELQLQKIKIYPNPNTGIIKFSKLEHHSCKVYNILGKEMKYHFSEENYEIDISHLKSGIYFLQIQGNNYSQRVVKIIKN